MFQCEQCPLKFSYEVNLLAHRKTHLTFFKCQQCTSKFTTKRNLVRHEKKHAGVRYPCTRCAITFSYKTNLIRHLKKFHGTYFCNPLYIFIYTILITRWHPSPADRKYSNRATHFCSQHTSWSVFHESRTYHPKR